MTFPRRYPGLTFENDFGSAAVDGGATIRLSRAERHLVERLCQNEGSVLSREQLLDAVAGIGSESRDRNIDFMIYRIRRKLADTAGAPKFIETRYGEGYAWIAPRLAASSAADGAFVVIGPIHGQLHNDRLDRIATGFARDLATELRLTMAPENTVVVDKALPAPSAFTGKPPQFSVELSFLDFDGRIDCALVLRHYATSQIIELLRRTVAARGEPAASEREAARRTARELKSAIWRRSSIAAAILPHRPMRRSPCRCTMRAGNSPSGRSGRRRKPIRATGCRPTQPTRRLRSCWPPRFTRNM